MKKSIVLGAIAAGCSAIADIQRGQLQKAPSSIHPGNIFQQPFTDLEKRGSYHVPVENYENDQCVFLEFI